MTGEQEKWEERKEGRKLSNLWICVIKKFHSIFSHTHRSGHYFEPILNYLRTGELIYDNFLNPQGILEEARFYNLKHLCDLLAVDPARLNQKPLTRYDVVRALIQTDYHSELRFQGVNLSYARLHKLDLRNINFKHAEMSNCDLQYSNLSFCNFERADVSNATLDYAQLVKIKAVGANFSKGKCFAS